MTTSGPSQEEVLERIASADEKLSGLAFKVAADPYIETLTFYRLYSGKVKAGDMVWNPRSKVKERMGRMVLMRLRLEKASSSVFPIGEWRHFGAKRVDFHRF